MKYRGIMSINYKYNENKFLEEVKKHVDATYSKHYGGKIQPVEFIMSNASTLDYLRGNVIKYLYRYGKKYGHNDEDLFKACHFMMMMASYAKSMNGPLAKITKQKPIRKKVVKKSK